jgi:hypothetical protein
MTICWHCPSAAFSQQLNVDATITLREAFFLYIKGDAVSVQTQTVLHVVVHYLAAEQPFKTDASSDETVGHLKIRVLAAFGLTEGPTPDGNQATYTLYDQKTPLENPNQALGDLAGHQHTLQLKLVQQIIQG